jgi:hypothetical protein
MRLLDRIGGDAVDRISGCSSALRRSPPDESTTPHVDGTALNDVTPHRFDTGVECLSTWPSTGTRRRGMRT